jgi:hypothetical protein
MFGAGRCKPSCGNAMNKQERRGGSVSDGEIAAIVANLHHTP